MKKIAIILILATVALTGCQGDMGLQRDDRVENMDNVYNRLSRSYDHLRAMFYVPVLTGPQSGFAAGGHMMAAYCDEAQEVSQSSVVYNWYDGRASSTNMPLWYAAENGGTERWNGFFSCIYGCNEALKYLLNDKLVTDYEDSQRKGMAAQFYALRAYCYLQLIKRWGGVPIIDQPHDEKHDYSKDKRASFAQCTDFIISSCDSALIYTADVSPDGLPWIASGSSDWQMPRLSRLAIWSIKSEAALYAASPLWAEDHTGTQPYTWARAAEITKAALDVALGHGAKLVDATTTFPTESQTGLNPYDKYFLSSYTWSDGWDHETLYQPYYSGKFESQVWKYAGLPIDVGQSSAGACPTQEMVDAYEVVSADGTQSAPLLNLSKPYNADGTPNFNPKALTLGYVDCSAKMYENRDPRFYATIYYDGVKLNLATGEYTVGTYVGGNCGLKLSPSNTRNTCTGYYLRKFNNATSSADAGNKDGYMRVFRLAELYLNFAEASFMAYGPDAMRPASTVSEIQNEGSLLNVSYGSPMSAREAVNAVRARVGMPSITESGSDFQLRLRNERRVELAFEEQRFFDVRRWCSPTEDLSATDRQVSGMRIEEQNGQKTYQRFTISRKCYTNKYLKYPVTLDEVRKMLALTGKNWQNEGWN